jgi:hypothetical protein
MMAADLGTKRDGHQGYRLDHHNTAHRFYCMYLMQMNK